MITKIFQPYLVTHIKMACFFCFSPVRWNSKRSAIERLAPGRRVAIFHCQLVIFTIYVLGMVRSAITGDAPPEAKLQSIVVVPIFTMMLILLWIWTLDIGCIQLINSLCNLEKDLAKGNFSKRYELLKHLLTSKARNFRIQRIHFVEHKNIHETIN